MAESEEGNVSPKTKEQLQADVEAARARLSDRIESLIRDVHPKSVANKAVNNARDLIDNEVGVAKQKVKDKMSAAKGLVGSKTEATGEFLKDEHGWRSDRFMLLGGIIAGLVTILLPIIAITAAVRRAVRTHKKATT